MREPDQGTTTGTLRRPHQLPRLRCQPVPGAAQRRRLRAGGNLAAGASDRHGVAGGADADDPTEAAEDRRSRGRQRPADHAAPGQRLSAAKPAARSGHPAVIPYAQSQRITPHNPAKLTGVRGWFAPNQPESADRLFQVHLTSSSAWRRNMRARSWSWSVQPAVSPKCWYSLSAWMVPTFLLS